jgi:hypothetical protein
MRYITKEDRTVAVWTILSVIALMSVAMFPSLVTDNADGWVVLGTYAGANDAGWEATTAINLAGLWHAGVMGAAFGMAFELGVGAGVGFVVGL